MKAPVSPSASSSASEQTITDVLACVAAEGFAKTVVAPIDQVELLIQLCGSIPVPTAPASLPSPSPSSPSPPPSGALHEGLLQILKDIVRREGVLSLWRGHAPKILTEAGSTALNFVFLNWYKRASHGVLASLECQCPSLREENGGERKRRLLGSFVSGGLAGASTVTILYPLGFTRTRLATDVGARGERRYPEGMRDVVRKIWRSDGIRGFYQGYGIALISVSMHRFVYLGGYDFVKGEFKERKTTLLERFGAAQVVSMSASTFHYPLDCVRRRLMLEAGKKDCERKYRNAVHCFRRVWAEEGWSGFCYLGLGPKLVGALGSALVLVSYDEFRKVLGTD
ncbi:hypothetical protein ACHAWF_017862 [Thalassiosira exigua]